ncbi:uncharacterized protein LOC132797715 [Drosophila nasuta]|uniref:uncharacterized protein LOC132797715 n=1 Tax=Drosophila nasuta TaxID=42062 RepID=UPI00295E94A1|nr:uncharacterized protein LOC132797715 [Drosophila nasuta]
MKNDKKSENDDYVIEQDRLFRKQRYKGPFIVTKVLPKDRYLVEDIPHAQRKQRPYKSIYSSDKMKHWCQLPPNESDDEEHNGGITAIDSCEDAAICQERPSVKLR